ncbi:MAG: hypothetical protein IJV31_06395, partial [Clostridia bacterium]|nr:hypothetical protein [Clostridia bacterium]
MRGKKHVEKARKLNKKKIGIIIAIVIAIIAISMAMIFNTRKEKVNIELNPELARTMKYARVENGEEKLKVKNEDGAEEDFAFVEFDAFFLKDLDGDGYADGVRGTCREVGKEDTLYMELKVLTNGYLKDGKIT